ncbi:hypothetical protein TNCV_59531 [Trichonephila clavipes]|nr:hypothetical protein TNCV_59531 [Trichonephila clavipes]
MNIEFCVPLGKSATETLEISKHMYSSDILTQTQSFKRHRGFKEDRRCAEDDESFVRPQTSRMLKTLKR